MSYLEPQPLRLNVSPPITSLALLACFVSVSIGCSPTARNQASPIKEQLQSRDRKPIELPSVKTSAATLIAHPEQLASTASIGVAEWQRRLKNFRVRTKSTSSSPLESAVDINDEHSWRQSENANWHVRHLSKGNVVEWMRHDDKLLVRNGKGDWRMRPMRIEFVDSEPQSVLVQLQDMLGLAAGRITLSDAGDISVAAASGARKAKKLKVTAKTAALTDPVYAETLTGEVTLDEESGLIVGADLTALVRITPITPPPARPVVLEDGTPAVPPTQAQKLTVKLSFAVEYPKNGESFETTLPKYVDEIVRPRPSAYPLAFWQGTKPDGAGKDGSTKDGAAPSNPDKAAKDQAAKDQDDDD